MSSNLAGRTTLRIFMLRVQLQQFEGPLDLLLFFIQRDEIEIEDIPIAHITSQFLETLSLMEELDLDIAGEFMYMASMLMSIKAKMLLPKAESDDPDEEIEDPRQQLIEQLLEYKRYKELGVKLSDFEQDAATYHPRGDTDEGISPPEETGEILKDVTLFHLMSAYKRVLMNISQRRIVHEVEIISYTVESQGAYLLDTLQKKGKTSFVDLCHQMGDRLEVVVTFLATLELIKEQQIKLLVDDGDDPTDFWLELPAIEDLVGMETTG